MGKSRTENTASLHSPMPAVCGFPEGMGVAPRHMARSGNPAWPPGYLNIRRENRLSFVQLRSSGSRAPGHLSSKMALFRRNPRPTPAGATAILAGVACSPRFSLSLLPLQFSILQGLKPTPDGAIGPRWSIHDQISRTRNMAAQANAAIASRTRTWWCAKDRARPTGTL